MGDVDGGCAYAPVQGDYFASHLHAQFCVEVGERLVHKEELCVAHYGAAERHALHLSARKLLGLAVEVGAEVEDFCRLEHLFAYDFLGNVPGLEAEADVVVHVHIGIESIALEHHCYVPVLAFEVVGQHLVDVQIAVGDVLKPGYHPERSRLAASRRADKHDKLVLFYRQVEIEHRLNAVVVHLVDVLEDDKPVHGVVHDAFAVLAPYSTRFLFSYLFFHNKLPVNLSLDARGRHAVDNLALSEDIQYYDGCGAEDGACKAEPHGVCRLVA